MAPKLTGKLEPGYERDIRTYARTDVTSRRNAKSPTPAKGRQGHNDIAKKKCWMSGKSVDLDQMPSEESDLGLSDFFLSFFFFF